MTPRRKLNRFAFNLANDAMSAGFAAAGWTLLLVFASCLALGFGWLLKSYPEFFLGGLGLLLAGGTVLMVCQFWGYIRKTWDAS